MPNPHVILYNNLPSVTTIAVPHLLSDYVVFVVVRSNQGNVCRNQNLITDFYIALKQTMTTDSDVVPDDDASVWRPHDRGPLNMDVSAVADPRIPHAKVKDVSSFVEKVIFRRQALDLKDRLSGGCGAT